MLRIILTWTFLSLLLLSEQALAEAVTSQNYAAFSASNWNPTKLTHIEALNFEPLTSKSLRLPKQIRLAESRHIRSSAPLYFKPRLRPIKDSEALPRNRRSASRYPRGLEATAKSSKAYLEPSFLSSELATLFIYALIAQPQFPLS